MLKQLLQTLTPFFVSVHVDSWFPQRVTCCNLITFQLGLRYLTYLLQRNIRIWCRTFFFQLSTNAPSKPTAKPTKQGFLKKLSRGKHQPKKWDNRYFELADTGHLYYYKKADGGKPINSIYLKGCPVEIDSIDASVLIVKTEERDWNLKAVNIEEARAWRDALRFYSDKK